MTESPQRGGSCPRCGAPYEATQEYCLECGARLPAPGPAAAAATLRRRARWTPRPWVAPVLTGLLIAAVMTGVAVLIARGAGTEDEPIFVATTAATVAAPTTETLTEPTTTETETETTTTPTTTRSKRPPQTLVEWPPSQPAYTVVIASLPTTGGRAAAIRKAREARRNGLRVVGVIDSAEFSSLHPGYYVVFSGIYENQRDALRATRRVQDLYPAAYVRQISR